MINVHSKYVNKHRNDIFYALIYINNHVNTSMTYMLSFYFLEFPSNYHLDLESIDLNEIIFTFKIHKGRLKDCSSNQKIKERLRIFL